MSHNILNNERGVLTIDFIFASMMIFSVSVVIFSMAMTLSVVEVVQYMSFATARSYSLAHLNETEQRRRANEKFEELSRNPAFTPLVNIGWFEIRNVQLSDFNSEFSTNSSDDSDLFIGARIPFSAPILYKRIPMIGTTASDPDQFTANVQSFLAIEPTFSDCRDFMEQRAQALQNLGASPNYIIDTNNIAIIMDNGC